MEKSDSDKRFFKRIIMLTESMTPPIEAAMQAVCQQLQEGGGPSYQPKKLSAQPDSKFQASADTKDIAYVLIYSLEIIKC